MGELHPFGTYATCTPPSCAAEHGPVNDGDSLTPPVRRAVPLDDVVTPNRLADPRRSAKGERVPPAREEVGGVLQRIQPERVAGTDGAVVREDVEVQPRRQTRRVLGEKPRDAPDGDLLMPALGGVSLQKLRHCEPLYVRYVHGNLAPIVRIRPVFELCLVDGVL